MVKVYNVEKMSFNFKILSSYLFKLSLPILVAIFSAITANIKSGDFDIEDGQQVLSVSRYIPDFKDQVGNTVIKVEFANYPASTNTRSFTSTVSGAPGTLQID